ncbi:MAG: HDOD domain-containing protein [Nitrospiraceae bacterium]
MSSAQELVRSCSNIFTLPEIYLRVRDVVDNPDSTMDDLANALKIDPAISARLLRIVNSPLYGSLKQSQIEQAIRHQLSPNEACEFTLHASIAHLAGAAVDHAELAQAQASQPPTFHTFALACTQFKADQHQALLKEAQAQLQDTLACIYPLAKAA